MHRFCWLRAVRLAWSSSVTSLTSPARCIGLSNRRSFGSFVFYVPFLVFIFAPRYSGRSWPFTENKAFTVITHRRPAAYLVSDKRKIQVYERVFRYWAKEKLGIAKKLTRRAILNFPDCMHSEIFIWGSSLHISSKRTVTRYCAVNSLRVLSKPCYNRIVAIFPLCYIEAMFSEHRAVTGTSAVRYTLVVLGNNG